MTKALSMMGHVNDLTVTWAESVGGKSVRLAAF